MKVKAKYYKIFFIILVIIFIGLIGWLIYRQVKEDLTQYDPKLQELKQIFTEFFSQDRYWSGELEMLNNRNFMKDIKLYRGDKSYTINKQKIYICMKDKTGNYYDDNMLIYVIAHELSHALCDEVGHTQKFSRIFDTLLFELEKAGIYDADIPIINNYCEDGDPEV